MTIPFPLSRYELLAVDYDGTLATDTRVAPEVVAGLGRLRSTGCHPVLVTGRELDDLVRVFPRFELFTYVVAENGAVLHDPHDQRTTLLADPPPPSFYALLRRERVAYSTGRVVVGSHMFYKYGALRAIQDAEVPLALAYNKDSIMILPSGIDKGTGLDVVLQRLQVPRDRTLAVGDAENDRALLRASGCGVAVANALESLKREADIVTAATNGRGVLEIINGLLAAAGSA